MAEQIFFHDRVLEKTILRLIPHWLRPNFFTFLRLLLVPVVLYLNYHRQYRLGIPLFIFAALTDAIDGSLARTRNQITDLGKLFDPVADKLLIGSMVILLVLRYLNSRIGYTILIFEALFILFGAYNYLCGNVLQANVWGKIKMSLQVIGICALLFGLLIHNPIWFTVATISLMGAIIFAAASLLARGV